MRWTLLLLFLLTGCVTVITPGALTPEQIEAVTVQSNKCPEYLPPRKRIPPVMPINDDIQGNYTEFLEELAERIARYVRQLELHMGLVEADHNEAYLQYRLECQDL